MSADTNQRIIPERKDVALLDTWDLTVLYEDDASWEADRKTLRHLSEMFPALKVR